MREGRVLAGHPPTDRFSSPHGPNVPSHPRGGDVVSDVNNIISAQLAELVANLDRDATDMTVGLRELIENGVRHVAGCQYAGITLPRRAGRSPA